jgi:NodT family efflux transporter outer membrane factor (OMF) lipoprotein
MSRQPLVQLPFPPPRTAAGLAIALLASACAVGPNFHRPPAPTVAGYTPTPLQAAAQGGPGAGGGDQVFVQGLDVSGQWWTLFHSGALNDLVAQALRASPDLEAARAALRVAQETYLAQRGALLPSAAADYNVTREKATDTLAPPLSSNNNLFTLHTVTLTVSYAPDVFGGVRRQVESAAAQAQAQRFQSEATYITLTANVVAGAIQEASLRDQVAATGRIIQVETDILATLRRQRALGQVAGLDVAAQESALAQAQQALPPLEKQLAQQRDQLAQLTGRTPGEAASPGVDLQTLTLPAQLPVSLPSRLVEQRPDVRAAEANLHAASAQVGVAVAARLPSFALTGQAGGASTSIGSLFTQPNSLWSVAGDVSQPIFQGGALLHKERAARAALDQARAQYRSTVLAAFQNVSDALQSLEADGRALAAAAAAEKSATATLTITRRQLEAGQVSGVATLLAEQLYQQAVFSRLQAQAARYADTVALFQALGGGWWNRKDV